MWILFRKLFFLLPAEFTHALAKYGLKVYSKFPVAHKTYPLILPHSPQNFLGVLNPIGLAAGFDKNAEILPALPALGFGYAEIGTVTPLAQPGNELPRLFRDPKNRNLFNRMGFNNWGAEMIAERVRKTKPKLPAGFKIGVNLGKNKLTPDHEAHLDYAKVARAFIDCADYLVINVSSPNTPGLRALQTPEALTQIVKAVQDEISQNKEKIPILVKLAPEMEGEALKSLIHTLEILKIDGLVLTNTVAGTYIYRGKEYSGGYSGQILTSRALLRLKEARAVTSLPIISVGGIFNAEDVTARLKAGANLVQWYSGWVYEGPFAVRKMIRQILPSL